MTLFTSPLSFNCKIKKNPRHTFNTLPGNLSSTASFPYNCRARHAGILQRSNEDPCSPHSLTHSHQWYFPSSLLLRVISISNQVMGAFLQCSMQSGSLSTPSPPMSLQKVCQRPLCSSRYFHSPPTVCFQRLPSLRCYSCTPKVGNNIWVTFFPLWCNKMSTNLTV